MSILASQNKNYFKNIFGFHINRKICVNRENQKENPTL